MNACGARRAVGLGVLVLGMAAGRSDGASAEAAARGTRRHHLMPVPASLEWGDGRLAVTGAFRVASQGPGAADPRVGAAVERFLARLEARLGLEVSRGIATEGGPATLVVEVARTSSAVPALGDDESYSLAIGGAGARLQAPTAIGALRGLETLLQLLEGDAGGWHLPAVRIADRPRFPWRGLMLDVCRHWMPIELVKRTLDGMAAVKLNVLHLHFTEDQAFRIESRRFPKLHALGSGGRHFTQAQAREIVAYAAERGIRVVPEFDMPGHATSWLVGYPELGSAPGPYTLAPGPGLYDASLDPTREEVYRFLDGFLGEMASVFPDAFVHVGGDENNGKHWRANPAITAFMARKGLADTHALQAYFNQRLSQIVRKHGKRVVGWEEVLHPDLPSDAVVQSWITPAAATTAASQGRAAIVSFGYYLDHMYPAGRHYQVDPLPADSAVGPDAAARVLGGEACMWSEFVDAQTVDSRIWPRLAAIAERLWSPRTVADVDDMYRRLDVVSAQLEEHGLTHRVHTSRMVRRLAGTRDPWPLETLAGITEPVRLYDRFVQFMQANGRLPTVRTPLTRLADAVTADPGPGRAFARDVGRLLADAPEFDRQRHALGATLEAWRAAAPGLARLMADRPALQPARTLATDLDALASIGLDALAHLDAGVAAGDAWQKQMLDRLAEADQARDQVQFSVIVPLRRLVVAAATLDQSRSDGPVAWLARIEDVIAPLTKVEKMPQLP